MALARFAWALASLEPFAVKWFERPRSMLSRERFRDMVYIDVGYCGNRIDVGRMGERERDWDLEGMNRIYKSPSLQTDTNNGDAA